MILDRVYFTNFSLAIITIERSGIMLYAIIKILGKKIAILRTCYSEAGAIGMLNVEIKIESNKTREDKELSWMESDRFDDLEDRYTNDVLDSFSIQGHLRK